MFAGLHPSATEKAKAQHCDSSAQLQGCRGVRRFAEHDRL